MKLLIGLGNPDTRYDNTRHNLGFSVLDELARKLNLVDFTKEDKFKSLIIKTPDLILVKPQTYMNKSGLAVSLLARFFKIKSEDIIVIHDELDLVLGKIKVRLGGGAGGHHGVESIIESLGTDKFIRVRLGIGNRQAFAGEHKRISFNAESFVMEEFMPNEKSKVKSMTKKYAIEAIDLILREGIEVAQNQFN
ncbi:aminoacyl-tRNA hydrolase [Candidatus Daviesbacteria bacterium]|nr:aminoacyl-tRNA hydrolase [Candidatus Daviesbacteria bacterium]